MAGSTGKHTHPGEEVSYVVDGMIALEVEGRSAQVLKASDAFTIPAGTVHNATNLAPGTTMIIANYIVEKGKPLTTQVS